ncbi:MAG: cysteine hydrolase family protein [Gemmatimonadota bacterium]
MDENRGRSSTGGIAVLVVDVQDGAVALGPYCGEVVIDNIVKLIAASRAAGVEVIYVQHDGEPGEELAPGSKGWEIHAAVRPESEERIVRKRFNSAFRETDLQLYLEERGIGTLILVGMQTEYCIDTTCRVAFENGFAVVMPEMTNTTYDNGELTARQIYEYHNRRIFEGRFATLRSMSETLRVIGSGGDFSSLGTQKPPS